MRPVTTAVVVLLFAAACGDGFAQDTASTAPDTATPVTTTAPTTTAPVTTTAPTTTTAPVTTAASTTTTAPVTTAASTTTAPAECAVSGMDVSLPDEPGLPVPVDASRRAVFDTASTCDTVGLADIAREGEFAWMGVEDDVATYFVEMEYVLFSSIVEMLEAPYGLTTIDGVVTYVWPSVAVYPDWASVPEPDRQGLIDLYGEGILDEVEFLWEAGSWQGPELAIDETGDWVWYYICKQGC